MRMRIPRFRSYVSFTLLKGAIKTLLFEGPCLDRFEAEFARYLGRKHAIAVPSGRMALSIALSALEIGKNDEIILPAFTVPEVLMILGCAGVIPRFADIDPATYNLSPSSVEHCLNHKVRAILMTHLFGKPCDVEGLVSIADRHGIELIEDAAQAMGAEYKGKKVGTFGRISYFSFGLVKNLNTLGGGMLVTDDDRIEKKVRSILSDFPLPPKSTLLKRAALCLGLNMATQPLVFTFLVYPLLYLLDATGQSSVIDDAFDEKEFALPEIPSSYKKRLTPFQACLGLEQLKRLDRLNEKRRENALFLLSLLGGTDGLRTPLNQGHVYDIYLNFMVCCDSREDVLRKLFRKGIDTTKGYLKDCSGLSLFGQPVSFCPEAHALSNRGFYLPVSPFMKRRQIERIAGAVHEIFRERGKGGA